MHNIYDRPDPAQQRKKVANGLLKLAKDNGVENNTLFQTTYARYLVQLEILDDLEEVISQEGTLVEKEYVKGRANLYANPAVAEYNRTTDSANKTVSTLMKIIKTFGAEHEDVDPLADLMSDGE